ncbi:MAG: NADH-quinone oxidoreductase subunit L [bacterium]
MSHLPLLILLFPLFGFLIVGLWGKRLGKGVVSLLSPGVIGLSFLCAIILFFKFPDLSSSQKFPEFTYFHWLKVGEKFLAPFSVLIDPLSLVMTLIVTGVSFLIHIYSVGYMGRDRGYFRYFAYLNLFVFFMLLLVLSNNYPLTFVGWEGVGLCSYLLIGFWFSDEAKATAGKKAFIVNRIGDFGFLVGLFLIWKSFDSFLFSEVAQKVSQDGYVHTGRGIAFWIGLCLFIGATGKSAQIPLYVWLPDAMAGPTPVSALIHAATMVTAGVYMVVRNHFIYALAPEMLHIIAWVGVITDLFAASIALVQNDIKKILAYSTISQLGYMFVGCGVGAFSAGIAHLMTHAYFKALLFLGAGSVIHSLEHAYHHAHKHADPQDIRLMGGLKEKLPITYGTFLFACLAIAGIPGFSGFFSKDEIIFKSFAHGYSPIGLVALITAGMTAFYMFRLFYLVFHGSWRGDREIRDHIAESPPVMTVPLIVLGILSVIGGWIAIPQSLGGGAWFDHFLQPVLLTSQEALEGSNGHHSSSLEYILMTVSVLVALGGIGWAYRWYRVNPEAPARWQKRGIKTYTILLNKYYVDEIYHRLVVQPTLNLAEGVNRQADVRVIDGIVNGIGSFTAGLGEIIRKVQTGLVNHYALFIATGSLLVLGWILLKAWVQQ